MITPNQQKLLDLVAAKTELKWVLNTDDKLNGDRQAVVLDGNITVCPYLAVPENNNILSTTEAHDFFKAADNFPGHDPELRLAILKACRLMIEAQPCH